MIFVLSRCLGATFKSDDLQGTRQLGRFHFKGVYWGHSIREIRIISDRSHPWEIGKDYLMLVDTVKVYNGLLFAELVKYKEV
jgi:hypothetical protein